MSDRNKWLIIWITLGLQLATLLLLAAECGALAARGY